MPADCHAFAIFLPLQVAFSFPTIPTSVGFFLCPSHLSCCPLIQLFQFELEFSNWASSLILLFSHSVTRSRFNSSAFPLLFIHLLFSFWRHVPNSINSSPSLLFFSYRFIRSLFYFINFICVIFQSFECIICSSAVLRSSPNLVCADSAPFCGPPRFCLKGCLEEKSLCLERARVPRDLLPLYRYDLSRFVFI